MNRSGHKHQDHNKKELKPNDLTKSIHRIQQPKTTKKSRSKSRHLKHHKKQANHKPKSPSQKHQDYFKLPSHQQFPSKQSSSLKANISNDYCVNEYFVKSTKPKQQQKKSPKNSSHLQQGQKSFNNNHEFKTVESQIQLNSQEYGFDYPLEKGKQSQSSNGVSSKISSMMKKISFSDKRALINCEGKIVSSSKQKPKKPQLNKSNSQNTLSFSKQYLTKQEKNESKNKSKSKKKTKSKSKQNKLNDRVVKDKEHSREHKAKHNESEKLLKAKSKSKQGSHQQIMIRQIYDPSKQLQTEKLPIKNYTKQPKHSYTQSSQTLASTNLPNQPYSYYQRFPTSTTIIDRSSTESCSSSSTSNLNTKPQPYHPLDMNEITAEVLSEINLNSITLRKEKELKYRGNFCVQRLKCLNLMANVCGQLRTKRQTFALAVWYFDKLILNFQHSNMKCIALTSIMLALKMDIPELLPKYCLAFRPNPQATIKKTNKSHKKKKSEHSSGALSIIKQKDSFLDTKDKLTLLITLPIYSTKDLYTQEKQEDFHIGEIIEMEVEMMSKLRFRFYFKTPVYWIDLLTTVWDDYMMGLDQLNMKTNSLKQLQGASSLFREKIFFKRSYQSSIIHNHKDFKLFSYLTQTTESALTLIQSYKYNPLTLTLSSMYLLIRLHLEQRKSLQPLAIYKHYRDSLNKSCNLIFCDSTGANQLFGNFLAKLNLSMAVIVEAVQFVSRFIIPENFKIYNYKELFGENYHDKLSNFVYNPNIFTLKNKA